VLLLWDVVEDTGIILPLRPLSHPLILSPTVIAKQEEIVELLLDIFF
jgi:hypothetical protein